jgi:hypothetical protein
MIICTHKIPLHFFGGIFVYFCSFKKLDKMFVYFTHVIMKMLLLMMMLMMTLMMMVMMMAVVVITIPS